MKAVDRSTCWPDARRLGLWPRASVRWQVVVFLGGLTMAIAALLARPTLRLRIVARTDSLLAESRSALQSGDATQALARAESAVSLARRSRRMLGPSLVMLGLSRERQADMLPETERAACFARATEHLSEAMRAGIPAQDRGKVGFHLGRCFYGSGQLASSLSLLDRTPRNYPPGRVEALRLLTRIYLEPSQVDLARAAEVNSELLRSPGLSADEASEAWELRAEILGRMGKLSSLMGLDESELETHHRWIGTLVRARESLDARRYAEAAAVYGELMRQPDLPARLARRAAYLLGLASRLNGDLSAALASWANIEQEHPDTEESLAAAVQSAEVLLAQGAVDAAVRALGRAAVQAGRAGGGTPCLLEPGRLEQVFEQGLDSLRSLGQFETALPLWAAYAQVVPSAAADLAAGRLHEDWARARLQEAETLPPPDAAQVRYAAAELFRTAGIHLVRAADATSPPDLAAPILWRAAQDLMQGEGCAVAFEALDRLLASDAVGDLRPDALALAAEALHGCGRHDRVGEYANACIAEYPTNPTAGAARFWLGLSLIASGDLPQAEITLRANLDEAVAEPEPQIGQRTRFVLARLLRDLSRDGEAIVRIHELLAIPADQEIQVQARLLLADCLRRRARQPAGRVEEAHSEQARSHYLRRKAEDLAAAVDQLACIERQLGAAEVAGRASLVELEHLRQSRWSIADCLYEMGNHAEAITRYQAIAEAQPETGDWFQAQMQIANCHWRMRQVDEARSVFRAAQARLERMPREAAERARIGMSESRWQEWLDWARRL